MYLPHLWLYWESFVTLVENSTRLLWFTVLCKPPSEASRAASVFGFATENFHEHSGRSVLDRFPEVLLKCPVAKFLSLDILSLP